MSHNRSVEEEEQDRLQKEVRRLLKDDVKRTRPDADTQSRTGQSSHRRHGNSSRIPTPRMVSPSSGPSRTSGDEDASRGLPSPSSPPSIYSSTPPPSSRDKRAQRGPPSLLSSATYESSTKHPGGPTVKGAARELGHEVKEYVKEKFISAMLRASKSLRRRNEAERANPKRWE